MRQGQKPVNVNLHLPDDLFCAIKCRMTPLQALKSIRSKATNADIARWAKVTRQAVGTWKKVPAERVLALEKRPELGLSRYDMRPDIYGDGP